MDAAGGNQPISVEQGGNSRLVREITPSLSSEERSGKFGQDDGECRASVGVAHGDYWLSSMQSQPTDIRLECFWLAG